MATHRFASEAPEKKTWNAMMNRCYNASAKDYLPGITVCERWHVFEAFLVDVGPRPSKEYTLKRKDRTCNFTPETTGWVKKHQKTKTRIYQIWKNMRYRTGAMGNGKNATTAHYQKRGIECCPEWGDFKVFYEDMGDPPTDTHTLDRKDNTAGYSKNNCRWATSTEQANNTSTNRLVTYCGQTKTVADWARELSISRELIASRLKLGWEPPQLFETPIQKHNREVTLEDAYGAHQTYSDAQTACASTGVSYSAAMKCLSGANKTSGGYKWFYTE